MFKTLLIASCLCAIMLYSCKQHGTPKPRAYYRISFPEHEYKVMDQAAPYTFEYPSYTQLLNDNVSHDAEEFWYNLNYPKLNGTVHISYKAIDDNLNVMLEDSRKLAYKHSIKADAIGEQIFISPEKRVFGTLYDIQGDAASSVQFHLTDSNYHFVRGSLYFNAIPNKDSLAPVVDFVTADIIHLMETFEWKKTP
ncbi:gliding motility lipoprotein GldD [Labilibacter marinus]|uniref:gliding motility lipoprotein GldD n=1 Tax=Labilibacter marinus TaxID=1477105 RepID=UPI0008373BE9|nr:gliding motility lipoprotein GldD [Labilibacter marinus]